MVQIETPQNYSLTYTASCYRDTPLILCGDWNIVQNYTHVTRNLQRINNPLSPQAIKNVIQELRARHKPDDTLGIGIVTERLADNYFYSRKNHNSAPQTLSETLVDIIQYCTEKQLPGLLLMLVFEKAFGTVEWLFVYKVIESFGFTQNMIK